MATKKSNAPTPRELCEQFGEEAVISAIRDGEMLTDIAKGIGVTRSALSVWIALTDTRSARVREARAAAAATYDEMAYEKISEATDPFSLAKAREQASHLRWRASKMNPGEYGDRQTLTHDGNVSMTLFDGEQARRMAELVAGGHKGN